MKTGLQPSYFRWLVLGGAFTVLFLVQGSRSIIGVAFKPIVNELDWARGTLSLILFVHMAVFALTLPVIGRCYDRYGAKWVVVGSSLCLAAGYLGITAATTFSRFMVFYGFFAAVGFGGCSITLFAALASKWFHRNRGLGVSLTLCGGPVGQFVMVPPATQVIQTHGWRWVFIGLGLVVLVVNLAIAAALLKNPPGLQSRPLPGSAAPARINPPASAQRDLTLAQALQTPSFWFFTILMFVCGGGDYLVITHLAPMVTDAGIPARTAGDMLAWFGLMGMAGLLVTGPLTDRFGNKLPAAATFALRFLIFGLILFSGTVFSFYVFALAFGFTMFITAPITTTLLARMYGLSHIGLISGVVTTVHHFSGGLWAYFGGAVFDRTGSYRPIFFAYACFSVLAFVCGLLIRERRHSAAGGR